MTLEELKTESRKVVYSLHKHSYMFGEFNEVFLEAGATEREIFLFDENSYIIIPDCIEIVEDDCTFTKSETIFDLLGVYKYQKQNTEGKIILYKKCIENFGKDYYNNYSKVLNKITESECINLIYKIVLWHELGHWITHWMLDSKKSRWDDRFWSLTPNPNDLLEGLAQIFTYYSIINDPKVDLLKLQFEFMLLGQSGPYKKHIEIIRNNKFSWFNICKALEKIRMEKVQDLSNYIKILDQL